MADYFVTLAQAVRANILAAIEIACRNDDNDRFVRGVLAITPTLETRGDYARVSDLLERADLRCCPNCDLSGAKSGDQSLSLKG